MVSLVTTVGYKTSVNDSENDILNSIDFNSIAPTLVVLWGLYSSHSDSYYMAHYLVYSALLLVV